MAHRRMRITRSRFHTLIFVIDALIPFSVRKCFFLLFNKSLSRSITMCNFCYNWLHNVLLNWKWNMIVKANISNWYLISWCVDKTIWMKMKMELKMFALPYGLFQTNMKSFKCKVICTVLWRTIPHMRTYHMDAKRFIIFTRSINRTVSMLIETN